MISSPLLPTESAAKPPGQQNFCGAFTAKQCCSVPPNNWKNLEAIFKHENETAPYSLSGVAPVSGSPQIMN